MLSNHASNISNVLLTVTTLKSGDISTSNHASNLSNGLLFIQVARVEDMVSMEDRYHPRCSR
jgi:hypothetical protein